MNTHARKILAAATAILLGYGTFVPGAGASTGDPGVIVEWNQLVQQFNGGPPFPQMRTYAMMHIAMADAVVAIEGGYKPYHARISASRGASSDAAAAQAARDVLAALLPAGTDAYDTALANRLASIPPGRRVAGVEVGKKAAAKILAWRQNDGYLQANPQNPSPFLASNLPGIWRPGITGPAQFPGLGMVPPFGLLTPTQFLPVPHPQLESAEYASDFNDVKAKGRATGSTRTDEETRFALVFAGQAPYANATNPLRLWQNVARDIALADRMSLVDTARLFALVNAAIHDSLQTAHTSKFVYRLWRPETAVPQADVDGNDQTTADTAWTPLLFTPPYPSHASNMSCIGTGASRMLANVVGTDTRSFTATWYTAGPSPTVVHAQNYDSFFALAQDQGSSRVWGGIHYRFEIDASEDACLRVADYIFEKYMRPRRWHGRP